PRFRAIVEKFLSRLSDMLSQMDAAFQQQDFDQLADLSHQLKGSSLNVGFPQLGSIASELEQLAKQQDTGGIPARLCELRSLAPKLVVQATEIAGSGTASDIKDSRTVADTSATGAGADRAREKHKGPLLSTRPLHNARLRAAVKLFVDQLDEHLDDLQAACQSQDFHQLGELAHRLKGSSANCGFQPLSDVASQVEQLAKQEAGKEVPQLLDELCNLKSRILIPEPGVRVVS
ncbi:MAG: Hpt domain-containing protein, partial [Planctomycetota bacterium]|nr:Hpt domain-containing protein [Planctomycetota bacterium]